MAKISAPALKSLASDVKGKPYSQGPWGKDKFKPDQIITNGPMAGKKRGPREGHGIWGDCSSSVNVLVNYVSGRDPWQGGRFNTRTMGDILPGRGFIKGVGGPGTLRISVGSGHTVARLPDGTDFEMTPDYGLFGSVKTKVEKYSTAFYMPASNFDGTTGGGGAAPVPQTSTASGSVSITASALNVRSGAGTNFRVLGVLKKGQTAAVTGAQGDWLRISYGGGSGWVSKQYTKAGAASSQPAAPAPAASHKVTVTASALNVRSGASTGSRVLGVLKKGQSVSVTGEQGGWLKIAYGSAGGWISKQYTKTGAGSSAPSSAPAAAPATKKATVTTNALNVRAGAGTGHKVVGSVKRGQSLTVSSESNGWLKISAGSISGWVSKQYTSLGSGASSSGGSSNNVASGKAAKVLRVARSHIGSKRWPSLCQAFVSDVFIQAGVNNVRRASAKAAEGSWGGHSGNPPAGAAVYMKSNTTAGKKYGHVGIATGNGLTIVHSAGGVRESSANSSWSSYSSWGWHGGTKLN